MSDREILKNPCYINDQIIEFYFRYLTFTYDEQDILFVSPAVSFLLANSDFAGIKHTAESLKLVDKKLIFFTINNTINNEDFSTDTEECTHWSLLVYYKTLDVFVHHDSVNGLNHSDAKKLYNTVKDFVGDDDDDDKRPTKIRKNGIGNKKVDDDEEAVYIEFYTPQQSNVYDCGLYVMKIAAVICEWYLSRKASDDKYCLWYQVVRNQVLRCYVENQMRSDLLEFVDLLKDNHSGIT
ncbi:NEDD8-specific protease 1-like [Chenopodium quinoa]|uniref:NEDD8-specific protease 1-like n=1 Tax=Chenopodium quinoa TaxID=63459 RepID=UPI000B77EFAB|nr:NEDD8-specific protease 1-like [Chenopodium quinoa]